MDFFKKLTGIIAGAILISGAIFYSINKKEEIGENFEKPSDAVEVFKSNRAVLMRDDFGKSIYEEIFIKAELDKKEKTLYFGNYTGNFDRKDWSGDEKERLPTNKKHSSINPVFSKIFILHPKSIKISDLEQRAFLVPQYGWSTDLKPFEEHKEAQMMIEGGEKIIEGVLSKIPIPFFREFIEEGIKSASTREMRSYEEMFKKIKKGYNATIVPSYMPSKLFGSIQTAREYKISFEEDSGDFESGLVLISLWAKIALGDPSRGGDNSFPNRYGELNNINFDFYLSDDSNKKSECSFEDFYNFCRKNHDGVGDKNLVLFNLPDIRDGVEGLRIKVDYEQIAVLKFPNPSFAEKYAGEKKSRSSNGKWLLESKYIFDSDREKWKALLDNFCDSCSCE